MKSKVDPLMKLLDHHRGEASRALVEARRKLEAMIAEHGLMIEEVARGEQFFDVMQRSPSAPEDHVMHVKWLDLLRKQIEEKGLEIVAQQAQVDSCREALAAIHLELKTLEKYKEGLEERMLDERKHLEAKELDEIAGQNHRRQQS